MPSGEINCVSIGVTAEIAGVALYESKKNIAQKANQSFSQGGRPGVLGWLKWSNSQSVISTRASTQKNAGVPDYSFEAYSLHQTPF